MDRRSDTARLTDGPSRDEPPATSAGPGRRPVRMGSPVVQFLLMFGLLTLALVLLRGNLLWSGRVFNPDEAELMAEGRTAGLDLFPYSGYTSSTHLFLWPFVLGLLGLLGVPLTLVTAHIIGGLSYVFLSTTGWFLMMRRIGAVRAGLLTLPTATVLLVGYGRSDGNDFLSMTSEALPLVILSVAALVMLARQGPTSTGQLVVGSMTAGLAVWAKPQSGPVAVALVAACVFMACVERQRSEPVQQRWGSLRYVARSGCLALLAFVTPTVVFVALMQVGGTLDDFTREPLAAMWNYTSNREDTQGFTPPDLSGRVTGLADFALSFPFAAVWALGALVSVPLLRRVGPRRLRVLGLVAVILPGLAALLCLLPIYPLFTHYANLLYLGCLLSSCVAVRLAVPNEEDALQGRRLEIVGTAVSAAVVGLMVLSLVPTRLGDLAARDADRADREASTLSADCPPGSRVLTWGWASELYLDFDWTPASRYVNATWQLYPSRYQSRWSAVMLDELRDKPPDCIVEALGPDFFAEIETSKTIGSTIPAIQPLLDSCYAASSARTLDDKPVTLYRRVTACPDD